MDSLATAHAYCITFQNMEFRKHLIRPKANNSPALPPKPINSFNPRALRPTPPTFYNQQHQPRPPHNPRQYYQPQQYQPTQHFSPQQYQPPQHYSPQQYQPPQYYPSQQFRIPTAEINSAAPQNTPFNGPTTNNSQNSRERSVPMEIDPSVRSRQVNYGNRPPTAPPQKRPRQFNIETQPQFYAPGPRMEQEHEYEKYEQYFQQPYETPNESSFERYY